MNLHGRKMIAPIIVTIVMVLYYVVYFGLLLSMLGGIWKYMLGILPIVFSAVMIKVCVERIKEIQEGEEDDLSKY